MPRGKPIFTTLSEIEVAPPLANAPPVNKADGLIQQDFGYEEVIVVFEKKTAKTYLGLACTDVDGLFYPVINFVDPGCPAHGQLLEGDHLVAVNGQLPRNADDAMKIIKNAKGDINLNLKRPNDLQHAIAGSLRDGFSAEEFTSGAGEDAELAEALRQSMQVASADAAGGSSRSSARSEPPTGASKGKSKMIVF